MARVAGNLKNDTKTVNIRTLKNVIKIEDGDDFISTMTSLLIIFVILSIASTESQENQINIGQKTTISALKFTGNLHTTSKVISPPIQFNEFRSRIFEWIMLLFLDNFIRTFYDTTYDNVVFVSRGSINNSDENLDQYITLMVSAQKLMIKFTSIYLR